VSKRAKPIAVFVGETDGFQSPKHSQKHTYTRVYTALSMCIKRLFECCVVCARQLLFNWRQEQQHPLRRAAAIFYYLPFVRRDTQYN
jgi:hypothetical protein